ncbi:1-deoxy-D-xylulose-5-phosphate reductoisomerase [Clostridium sp. PL3]|uniref:1-deoxy-D-xylulose 5-phosphate reductoisomerase n=1 Tax=Clostridium thailandense TaxID=2794346 RepID=A0A949TL63_9CLOT|nr:1-deoxy-D-xylulose-5-phosphate reductoisomerase [Clostridium thailandense]MBV7274899.1 1-deoxy-D-xylulose-5-phosphate reductoisomerase [Clostridium thailandense]
MKKVAILGATGSIGNQTLDVIRQDIDRFRLIAISANSSYGKVIEIINEFNPLYVVLTEEKAYEEVKKYCSSANKKIEILFGMEGLNTIASLSEIDIVVTSVVGMIGLVPTITAIKSGKDIALANKETLVTGGEIVISEAKKHNVKILPVDSEHGAIFQCLQGNEISSVDKILLTASGGPFRGKKEEDLRNVTVDEALKHPKWNMGKKISIDSATLMNKGLEVIEAHWLFDMDYDDIEVVVHPQSIIHSMIEYKDGSIIAQLGSTDMRLPIQYALNYPKRQKAVVEKLDFYKMECLTFEKPDMNTFKPLKLAYEAGKIGGTMPAVLNAANECAVDLFLNKKIKFLQLGNILEKCMDKFIVKYSYTLEDILELDKEVKKYVNENFGK